MSELSGTLVGWSLLALLAWSVFLVAYCERKRKSVMTSKELAQEAEEDRANSQW
jgi:hypothetical protein